MSVQGKNSQRELKQQLSEKSSAAIQALLRIAATVNKESGSEVIFDSHSAFMGAIGAAIPDADQDLLGRPWLR